MSSSTLKQVDNSYELQRKIAIHLEKYAAIWNTGSSSKMDRDMAAYQWTKLCQDVGAPKSPVQRAYNTLRKKFREVRSVICLYSREFQSHYEWENLWVNGWQQKIESYQLVQCFSHLHNHL